MTSRGNMFESFMRITVASTTVCLAIVMCGGCHSISQTACDSSIDCDSATCAADDCNAYFCLPRKHYSRCIDERFATHEAAKRAFISMRECYPERPNLDFQFGYRSAFVDIALGGDGVVPAVPPEQYWTTCYRTAEGHQHAQDWFAGYAAGAAHATAHCRYQYNTVAASGVTGLGLEGEDSTGIIKTNGSRDAYWGDEVDSTW
ncbi:MAG: hypothetical protein KDA93_01245 [Planctomycetaceae bacterium]|nr:hypothetical protein [Planctomycetaceae bacterium]